MADKVTNLEEMDVDEGFTYSHDERRIFTQAYDLSIQTLVEQWDAKTLILPESQREYVWDDGRASRLIESLILNIPIPVLYFAETEDSKYQIIDGHQRVRSIVRFINNEFSLRSLWVLNEYTRLRFHQLPQKVQRSLKMKIMRAVIISQDSHPNMKFEIFERLNSGSIILNSQEMRNSLYRGSFNDMLRKLVKNETFRSTIGTRTPRKRMVDEELILRFFSFRERYDRYRAPLKRFMNEYMQMMKDADNNVLMNLEQHFDRTISNVFHIFGISAFRITDEHGHPREKSINRALYDAQMLACCWLDEQDLEYSRTTLHRHLSYLYNQQDFLDSIQKATGNTSKTKFRVRRMVEVFQEAELRLTVPFNLNL